MDAVTLHVNDLGAMSEYYREALALDGQDVGPWHPQTTAADTGSAQRASVVLGREGRALMVLVSTPGLPASRPGQAGLFHTALLYPDRPALAAVVASAGRHPRSRYVGAADHLVSQAFYFTDPEDNGIELYWDRPREQWPRRDGQIQIDTLPLDVEAFMSEHLGGAGGTTAQVGHVHLKVGDIETARAFYVHTLGFEVTAEVGGALFFSAGGYHHHMGVSHLAEPGRGSACGNHRSGPGLHPRARLPGPALAGGPPARERHLLPRRRKDRALRRSVVHPARGQRSDPELTDRDGAPGGA